MKKLLIATLVISYGLWSCKGGGGGGDDPAPKTLKDSVTYNTMVKPIFTKYCTDIAGCHASGAGGVDLRKYATSVAAATNKELIKAINYQLDANRNMPKGFSFK